jgi:hypothetical protein
MDIHPFYLEAAAWMEMEWIASLDKAKPLTRLTSKGAEFY